MSSNWSGKPSVPCREGRLAPAYERDGFIPRVEVVSAEKAGQYASKLQSFIQGYRHHPGYADWTYSKSELLLPWVVDLASESKLLDAVQQLIGPNILLWNAFLPIKPPHSPAHFGWHQDATYWPVAPTERMVSAWVALAPVGAEGGAMRMIPGSHRLGPMAHEKTYDRASMLKRGQRVSVPIEKADAVDVQLGAGQASLHHTLTVHGSGVNRTERWRLAVALNYAAPDVRPIPGHEDCAMLLRGEATDTAFVLEQRPDSELSAAALERFAKAMKRQATRYADVQSGE